MNTVQAGILQAVPPQARYLSFLLRDMNMAREALQRLSPLVDGQAVVLGLGPALVQALQARVPGLRGMPDLSSPTVPVPTQGVDLLCWLRGDDRGELLHRGRQLEKALSPAFTLGHSVDAFRHAEGRDLTGYEDGTENPQGPDALNAAVVQGEGAGLDGASFMAAQQWQHNFDVFEAMTPASQDNTIGRRRSDNEELDDAPLSAHVKRTNQESFDPAAFVLRRSMPWSLGPRAGLMFVAFGKSFEAFEAQMRRMAGLEDGVVDALFQFTRPLNGAYFWCPPMRPQTQGVQLDLRQLGL